MSERFNIYTADVDYDDADPDGYRAGINRFGKKIGAVTLGASVYEVPPGQAICPYHYEYGNEEWLIVLEGRPTLRTPRGEDELAPGDVVPFVEGPDGAHKLSNRTDGRVRVFMVSTVRDPSIAVYPDGDKIGVWSGDDRDRFMLRREDGARDYYDRET